MPWKDDSKADPRSPRPSGPWEAPGAAVAPPPKPKAAPRPWDDADGAAGAPAPKRPRLPPLRRPRAAAERTPAAKSDRPPSKTPRQRRAPKTEAPDRRGPDVAELKRRASRALAVRFSGAHGRRLRLAFAVGGALGVACGWALSGFYTVGADQTAVLERFGAFTAEAGPGVHYHLPWPVGRVRLVPVGPPQGADGGAGQADASTRMLAADGAPVEVSYALSWRVTDPRRYLFRIADAPELVKQLGEGAVRRAVGSAPLQALLTGDRTAVEAAASASLQQSLDRLGAGVRVGAVELRGVDPADAAEGAARDLAAAQQDARGAQADATAYRDRITAQARGEAAKALQEAKGVADQEIAEARGEADRFAALDAAYRQAPDATRERLYAETMERVLKATDKVVVDAPKGSTLVLPGSVMPQHGGDASTAPAATPPATASPATPSGSGGAT